MRTLVKFLLPVNLIYSCTPCFAQQLQDPQNLEQAVQLIPELQKALQNQNWLYASCVVLMLVVYAIKKFGLPKTGEKDHLVPIISTVLGGVVGSVITTVGGGQPTDGIATGVLLGNAASGAYDAYIKPIKRRTKKP